MASRTFHPSPADMGYKIQSNRQYCRITVSAENQRYGFIVLINTNGFSVINWNGASYSIMAGSLGNNTISISGATMTINSGSSSTHWMLLLGGSVLQELTDVAFANS